MITDSLFESIVVGSDGLLAALGAVDLYFIASGKGRQRGRKNEESTIKLQAGFLHINSFNSPNCLESAGIPLDHCTGPSDIIPYSILVSLH